MSSKIRVRDMPKIRDELFAAEQHQPRDTDPLVSDYYLQNLRKASLWWVSEDMTELVAESYKSMPEWSPSIAAPEPEGLIAWAGDPCRIGFHKSLPFGSEVNPTNSGFKSADFPMRAMYWHFCRRICRVTIYADSAHAVSTRGTLEEFTTFDFRADVPFDQCSASIEVLHARTVQILGASWLLMQQPTVAEARRVSPRTGRRKPSPDAPPSVNDVQIIDLRRLATKRSEEPYHGEGREYHVRWLVRGHWRQQACGPGRKFRRPVYVAPHIRGPEGAPLKTERVNVWRR